MRDHLLWLILREIDSLPLDYLSYLALVLGSQLLFAQIYARFDHLREICWCRCCDYNELMISDSLVWRRLSERSTRVVIFYTDDVKPLARWQGWLVLLIVMLTVGATFWSIYRFPFLIDWLGSTRWGVTPAAVFLPWALLWLITIGTHIQSGPDTVNSGFT